MRRTGYVYCLPPDLILMSEANSYKGAPYKFAVTVQSKAFDEAPPSILKAVHRMIWAGRTAARTATAWILQRGEQDPVPAGDVVFNELLSLGYMEDDRISVSPWCSFFVYILSLLFMY